MNFGYVLKTLRIEAGIGLRELARTIDISPSYLSMIEKGKQPPPAVARIAQIEDTLNVPTGYLLSITEGFNPDVTSFIQDVPEAVDFLNVAMKRSMTSADFMELTGLVNAYGWKGLKEALKKAAPQAFETTIDSQGQKSRGPYLWPFLRETLIFDVGGIREKASFLEEAVARMVSQTGDLNPEPILKGLLEREKAASTGIGKGVAVPHAYTTESDGMVVALFRIPDGLDFDAIDEQPVYLVLILAGPRSSDNLHLKLLARIAKLFSHNSFYENILEASSQGEIISTFKLAEMTIP